AAFGLNIYSAVEVDIAGTTIDFKDKAAFACLGNCILNP
ncbi:hypothetical protein LCGC14_2429860, partial [marine sediment metagenome]